LKANDLVTGENINLNDGIMPKKEQYKKNYPVETGKIMREKYENGLIRNEHEFKEVLNNVLFSSKRS
jgi:hypothetical protein